MRVVKSAVGHQKNTISINGKVVDAKTGTVLAINATSPKNGQQVSPRVLDGFFKGSAQKVTAAPRRAVHTAGRSAKAIHQKTQHSTTLLRAAVKRPLPRKTLIGRDDDKGNQIVPPSAKHIPKSGRISRFGSFSTPTIIKKTAELPVKNQPLPAKAAAAPSAAVPLREKPVANLDSLLNEALHKASSHEQQRHSSHHRRRFRRRLAGIGSIVAIVALLGGFFAYQNAANVSVKLASTRANVQGVVPGYKPSGFTLSRNVTYEPGKLTLNFSSNSDSRAYQIIQQSSNWNSETLYSSFVSQKPTVSQANEKGKTIYLYDGSNATWVDGGVWYQITGNSALSSAQLLKVADSM